MAQYRPTRRGVLTAAVAGIAGCVTADEAAVESTTDRLIITQTTTHRVGSTTDTTLTPTSTERSDGGDSGGATPTTAAPSSTDVPTTAATASQETIVVGGTERAGVGNESYRTIVWESGGELVLGNGAELTLLDRSQ